MEIIGIINTAVLLFGIFNLLYLKNVILKENWILKADLLDLKIRTTDLERQVKLLESYHKANYNLERDYIK